MRGPFEGDRKKTIVRDVLVLMRKRNLSFENFVVAAIVVKTRKPSVACCVASAQTRIIGGPTHKVNNQLGPW